MNHIKTDIDGVFILEPRVFDDARGYFFESYKKEEFDANIGKTEFIQDNESKSTRGVLRGLHYQKGEFSQAKLVRVIEGTVLDVAVDLRKSSPTYGKHIMVELSSRNKRQLAVFTYKVDNVYAPSHEASIKFDDKTIGIKWPLPVNEVKTSSKDLAGASFEDAEKFD